MKSWRSRLARLNDMFDSYIKENCKVVEYQVKTPSSTLKKYVKAFAASQRELREQKYKWKQVPPKDGESTTKRVLVDGVRKKYTVTTPNKMNIMTNMDRIAEKNIGLKDHNNGMLQSGRPMVVANKMRNKYFLVLTSKRVYSVLGLVSTIVPQLT